MSVGRITLKLPSQITEKDLERTIKMNKKKIFKRYNNLSKPNKIDKIAEEFFPKNEFDYEKLRSGLIKITQKKSIYQKDE